MTARVLDVHAVRASSETRPHGVEALPATTFRLRSGDLTLVVGDPGPAHPLLALALGGRLEGGTGLVTLDGDPAREALQRGVALVDVPGVSEPDPGVPVRTVVGEELAMAGRPAGRRAVVRQLEAVGLDGRASTRVEHLTARQRVEVLVSLALLRRPAFVVLTLPERLGGLPEDWLEVVLHATRSGHGVVLTASRGYHTHFASRVPAGDVVTIGNAEEEQA